MLELNADGNKLVECGEEIISLCDKYNLLVEELFSKLQNIPNTCWTGDSANTYSRKAMIDKMDYLNIGKALKSYGTILKNTGKNINNTIQKWNDR